MKLCIITMRNEIDINTSLLKTDYVMSIFYSAAVFTKRTGNENCTR